MSVYKLEHVTDIEVYVMNSKINNNVEVCHVVSICILKQMRVFNLFVRNKAIIKINFHCIIFYLSYLWFLLFKNTSLKYWGLGR